MNDEIKEITKVDKQLLDKIEHILASELSCKEYDVFYNYFNEIRKPNILIDIKDDENIKDLIINLQEEIEYLRSVGSLGILDSKCKELQNINKKQKEVLAKIKEKVNQYEFISGYYDGNYDGQDTTYSHDTLKEDILELLEVIDNE